MSLSALIIDDEKHSRETTRMLLATVAKEITILAESDNARSGASKIKDLNPDIVFLDIQMPGMTGIEMLDLIPEYRGEIVFITAHDKYAIDAFKKGAIHYLLKPIDPDDLEIAIQRVKKTLESRKQKSSGNWLSLSSMEGWIVIRKSDIIRCESYKNYSTITTKDASHTISKTLKEVEQTLSPDKFYRVHNSHVIHLEAIDKILKTDGGNVLLNNGDLIPISKGRKKDFFDWFQERIDSV